MKDYQVYLPKRPDDGAWGCNVTSVGYARVLPGGAYPPHRHPTDHHFTWAHGRILNAWQLVFVSEGRGVFESAPAFRKENFEAGTVLMLFPGVWHRYAPDPKTGWVEHWIEFRGRALDGIIKTGILQPQEPLLSVGANTDLLRCFERCHELAARGALSHQDNLSTMALHILSVLDYIRRIGSEPQRGIDTAVERGQTLISLGCGEPLNLPKLAQELGVSYSHFRQAFKTRTGLSPKQHHMHERLRKAEDFLANTSKSVKEIADILGYDSPGHLSKQFKAAVGLAPNLWRIRQKRSNPPKHSL